MRTRCRMMPRWRGVVSRSNLRIVLDLVQTLCLDIPDENATITDLFLFPASLRPSTVELILPSAPSTTVSQLLWISSHAALLLLLLPPVSPPLEVAPGTGPVDRVPCEETTWASISSSEWSSATYSPSESAMSGDCWASRWGQERKKAEDGGSPVVKYWRGP